MPATDLWKFATGFDPIRQNHLSTFSDFAQIITLLCNSIESIIVEPCKGVDAELRNCVQPVFTLNVSEEAFDAFFNSPAGYRACYLLDPNVGLTANLALVGALFEQLVGVATSQSIAELASIDLRTSLLATSCKVWVHEDDFPFQSLTTDLAVNAWLEAASAGEKKAKWGLCAPKGTRIQIKGALIDPWGNEVVPRKKALRRYEIQRFGFS